MRRPDFSKLFNIRSDEWPRVFLLFLMAMLTTIVSIWGTTIAYAAFLQDIGVGALPWISVVSAILSIAIVAVYSAFADSIRHASLLSALYAIGAVCVLCGVGLLWFGFSRQAYLLLYLCDLAWTVAFNSHFTTYVNSFYDIQSAKRILPTVFAGFRAGAIFGGLTMPLLTERLAPDMILMLWCAAYFLIAALISGMPFLLHEHNRNAQRTLLPNHSSDGLNSPSNKPRISYRNNIKEGFEYTLGSIYLRWMAVGAFFLMILIALLEYRSSEILLGIYGTSEELAAFLAVLIGLGNLFVLPTLLFGISRIVARLGVGNASLLFPAGNLLIGGGLIFFPGFISAAIAYLNRKAFRPAFQAPIHSLLYNAIPLRIKGRARAFVDGLVVPLGSLIGGLLLLLPFVSRFSWFVPSLLGSVALAYMGSALIIRRHYGEALVRMLKQEDYSFLLSQEASDLTVADPATLEQLQAKLKQSDKREFTIFMAQLLSQIGGKQALPFLEDKVRSAPDASTRSALLNIVIAGNLHGRRIQQLYLDFFHDPDEQVRQAAIHGLVSISRQNDSMLVSRLLEMVHDPDLEVCTQALSELARTGDFYHLTHAALVLTRLLESAVPQERLCGIRVIKQIGDNRAIQKLSTFLTDQSDAVRLEAIVALEELADNRKISKSLLDENANGNGFASSLDEARTAYRNLLAELIDRTHALLRDPVERVRQAALTILGALEERNSHQAIIHALNDPSPRIRRTASDILAQAGSSSIPLLHAQLNAPSPCLRKMAAVTLTRIHPKEFSGLLNTNITGNLLAIYQQYGAIESLTPYTSYAGIAVLQNTLRERNRQLIDGIFYFLSALYEINSVQVIHESLRSEHAHVRANAAEALETMTTPQTSSLIAPLFEPDVSGAHLLSISQQTWEMEAPEAAAVLRQFLTHPDDGWLRAIATFALGEMGEALRPSHKEPPAAHETTATEQAPAGSEAHEGRKRRRPRRSLPDDLLGALTEKSSQAVASEDNGLFSLSDIETLLATALKDADNDVRMAAQAAKRMIAGYQRSDSIAKGEFVLSTIEKIIFLKEVPFFQGMTIEQLKILANVCEEEFFAGDTRIFHAGDAGGVLYVVMNGRVGIEREKRKGSFARLATIEAHSYFGEMNLFDASPRSTSAIALQDTLTLKLRREPLIALARQHPDLSLELINVLSQRLRETSDRIADLTRTRPRQLHKLFDQFEETT